jgi:hypothetical protein
MDKCLTLSGYYGVDFLFTQGVTLGSVIRRLRRNEWRRRLGEALVNSLECGGLTPLSPNVVSPEVRLDNDRPKRRQARNAGKSGFRCAEKDTESGMPRGFFVTPKASNNSAQGNTLGNGNRKVFITLKG